MPGRLNRYENWISDILLEILVQYALNPPPDVHSAQFFEWQNEMKIHTYEAADKLKNALDELYGKPYED